ncbi:MAG TPA: calcium/sodium antiporter [bacterium]|nr:calcium/sodium antiporter [bacterium]
MIISCLVLVFGLALLIKSADILVDGSVAVAKRLAISEIVIGLTIVSFGTSAPELIVNILSSINQKSDIVIGNVVGSNIVNILLILGTAGIIYPLQVQKNTAYKEIPLSFFAALLIIILGNDIFFFGNSKNIISASDGLILLFFFAFFLFYIYKTSSVCGDDTACDTKQFSVVKSVILIACGLAGLIWGGNLVVNNAVLIAKHFGVSEKLIALTIISIGTSLPELATSAVAAYKKKSDIAVGNIIGSNIFNIFLILGVSSAINPVQYDVIFNSDITALLLSTLALFLCMFTITKRKLDRAESALMLLLYCFYTVFIVYRQ